MHNTNLKYTNFQTQGSGHDTAHTHTCTHAHTHTHTHTQGSGHDTAHTHTCTHAHTHIHTHTHTHRAAAMTLRTVLLSIQALLQAAEPDDPQDAVVARQYKEDPELYKKTARHWAQVYAGGEGRGGRESLLEVYRLDQGEGYKVPQVLDSLTCPLCCACHCIHCILILL